MQVRKIGVFSPRLYVCPGTVAVDFPMIVNAVLTITSTSKKLYSKF
jgi:hypothetical protein